MKTLIYYAEDSTNEYYNRFRLIYPDGTASYAYDSDLSRGLPIETTFSKPCWLWDREAKNQKDAIKLMKEFDENFGCKSFLIGKI